MNNRKIQKRVKEMLMISVVACMIFSLNACNKKETQESNTTQTTSELTVLAAASLTDVAEELAKTFNQGHPDITIVYSFGGSGALQTQIEEGAQADIFFSAGTKQMDALIDAGLIMKESKKDLLLNTLVLIVPKNAEQSGLIQITSFEDVAQENVKLVALGEPTGVPVGQYAQDVFMNLGIFDIIKEKANYGSDVRQVLTWVETGEADCGVVYATDAIQSNQISVVCEAPLGTHKPIIYPIGIIQQSKKVQQATSFIEFLSSQEARKIFETYGFKMN